jgi:hypothetical protein
MDDFAGHVDVLGTREENDNAVHRKVGRRSPGCATDMTDFPNDGGVLRQTFRTTICGDPRRNDGLAIIL